MTHGDCEWGGELVQVQGFGFMPSCVNKEIEDIFEVGSAHTTVKTGEWQMRYKILNISSLFKGNRSFYCMLGTLTFFLT